MRIDASILLGIQWTMGNTHLSRWWKTITITLILRCIACLVLNCDKDLATATARNRGYRIWKWVKIVRWTCNRGCGACWEIKPTPWSGGSFWNSSLVYKFVICYIHSLVCNGIRFIPSQTNVRLVFCDRALTNDEFCGVRAGKADSWVKRKQDGHLWRKLFLWTSDIRTELCSAEVSHSEQTINTTLLAFFCSISSTWRPLQEDVSGKEQMSVDIESTEHG